MDDDDSNDHTVDTQDTSHDDLDDGFHDKFGFKDTHWANTNTCFSATVGSTKVGKNQGWCDSDVSEEVVVSILGLTHWFEIVIGLLIINLYLFGLNFQ